MSIEVSNLLSAIVGQSPVVTLLIVVIVLGHKGVWAWGREVERLQQELQVRDRELAALQQAALRSLLTAEEGRALSVQAQAVTQQIVEHLRSTASSEAP